MPTKNNHSMIRPLSFLNLKELKSLQHRFPNSLPTRFSRMFLIDTQQETYFLLDIANLSEEVAQKHNLLFEKLPFDAASSSHSVSEIRRAYHENDTELLDQLRINILVSQTLEIIEKKPIVENFSKIEDVLTCSISQEPFIFPMLTPYGQTYEQDLIVMHLKQSPNDPLAFKLCSVNQLVPNKAANQLIQLVYQSANADQQKKRIDSLLAKKAALVKSLDKLPLNLAELSMSVIFQEKEKLIKKRDRLLGFTSGWIPVLINILVIILIFSLINYVDYFRKEPSDEEIKNWLLKQSSDRLDYLIQMWLREELERGVRTPMWSDMKNMKDLVDLVRAQNLLRYKVIKFMSGIIISIFLLPILNLIFFPKINQPVNSLNEQIAQLSDWIEGSEHRELQLKALDKQIVELNKLAVPKRSSAAAFFQNPDKCEDTESSVNTVLGHKTLNRIGG